ncbi:unnamed protein product, partial [Meganyctiphanes norvegica]
MEKIQAQLVEFLQHPRFDPVFTQIETKTKVKREALAGGSLALLALYLIFGAAAELICNIIGFIYPAYCSVKAIETTRKSDDTQWLTYWVVFAVLSIIELPFEDFILHYFPIYWLTKTVFLMWCYLPSSNNGADFVYKVVIRPLFKQHETEIDHVVDEVTDSVIDAAAAAKKRVLDTVKLDDVVASAKKVVAEVVKE